MGVEVYVDLERDVDGMPYPLTKTSLMTAMDEVIGTLGLAPLSSFLSASEEVQAAYKENYGISREEALEAGFEPEEFDELDLGLEQVKPEIWFPAFQGLETVRGLLQHLRSQPSVLDGQEWYVRYLEEVEALLEIAEKQTVGFHFTAASG